jgi:hypothetical protein
MFSTLDFSLRLHIASFAPELIEVFPDLKGIKSKIVCPFHENNIIYINKPCKTCCFVRRLSLKEMKRIQGDSYCEERALQRPRFFPPNLMSPALLPAPLVAPMTPV